MWGVESRKRSKKWFPLVAYECQSKPLGIHEIRIQLELSSHSKFNPSQRVALDWGTCSHFHGGLWATGWKLYSLLCLLILRLFFIDVNNHIRASWVFKWRIRQYCDWFLTSVEFCWAAFVPTKGEFRALAHSVLQPWGPNLPLKSAALQSLLRLLKFVEHISFTSMWRIWHLSPAGVNVISLSLHLAFSLSKIDCKMRNPCQL